MQPSENMKPRAELHQSARIAMARAISKAVAIFPAAPMRMRSRALMPISALCTKLTPSRIGIFVKGNSLLNGHLYRQALVRLAQSLSAGAGLHVEFKLDSLEKPQKTPLGIFSYHLGSGHRIIYGEQDPFLHCGPHLQADQNERSEAARA